MATVDHIITRNDPRRGKIKGKTVLACNQCNNKRNCKEERQLQKENKNGSPK